MERLLIIGAGGHAEVVMDAVMRAGDAGGHAVAIGYLDDNASLVGTTPLGLPVLGPLSAIACVRHDRVVVAIGDNGRRREIFEQLRRAGERFATVVHPSATIARGVRVGAGTMVLAGTVVNTGAEIGENVILNTSCSVDHHCTIGSHAHIAPGSRLGGDAHVGEGVLLGIGAVVMPQRRVGAWSVVGAAALVHRDLPERVVAVGVPARVIRRHPAATQTRLDA